MKLLRFLMLVFQRGSFFLSPYDFAKERHQLLSSVQYSRQHAINEKKLRPLAYTLRANLGYLLNARQMNTQLFISHEKQLVYVRILKCASTSFLKELLPYLDAKLQAQDLTDQQVDAISFDYVSKQLTPEERSFQKVALVRNPFHRLVSVYLDLFDPDAPHFTYDAYWFGILNRDMSFEAFVDTLSIIPENLKGPHFASQYFILEQTAGLANIRIFNIDKDQPALENFLHTHGLRLGQRNKQEAYRYASFYNRKTLEKAYRMYKKDVDYFNYKDEYKALLSEVGDR